MDNDPVKDLARPFVSEPRTDKEPFSVLSNATRSVGLEDIASDPRSVLENEKCDNGLEDMLSDPINVLKNEECSTRVAVNPIEPDRFFAKPLTSKPARDSEPVRVLDSEM